MIIRKKTAVVVGLLTALIAAGVAGLVFYRAWISPVLVPRIRLLWASYRMTRQMPSAITFNAEFKLQSDTSEVSFTLGGNSRQNQKQPERNDGELDAEMVIDGEDLGVDGLQWRMDGSDIYFHIDEFTHSKVFNSLFVLDWNDELAGRWLRIDLGDEQTLQALKERWPDQNWESLENDQDSDLLRKIAGDDWLDYLRLPDRLGVTYTGAIEQDGQTAYRYDLVLEKTKALLMPAVIETLLAQEDQDEWERLQQTRGINDFVDNLDMEKSRVSLFLDRGMRIDRLELVLVGEIEEAELKLDVTIDFDQADQGALADLPEEAQIVLDMADDLNSKYEVAQQAYTRKQQESLSRKLDLLKDQLAAGDYRSASPLMNEIYDSPYTTTGQLLNAAQILQQASLDLYVSHDSVRLNALTFDPVLATTQFVIAAIGKEPDQLDNWMVLLETVHLLYGDSDSGNTMVADMRDVALDKIRQLSPDQALARLNQGKEEAARGDMEAAMLSWQIAGTVDPTLAEAYYLQARYFNNLRQDYKLMKLVEKLKPLVGYAHPWVQEFVYGYTSRDQLITVDEALANGDKDRALLFLFYADVLDPESPEDPEIHAQMARVYASDRNIEQAILHADKVLALSGAESQSGGEMSTLSTRLNALLAVQRRADIDKTVQELKEYVADEIKLEFTAEVPLAFEDRQGLLKKYEASTGEEEVAVNFDIFRDELLLLGIISPELDLRSAYIAGSVEGLLGLYQFEDKTMYIYGDDDLSFRGQSIVAHELTHALQDQHFDLSGLTDDESMNSDQSSALRAAVEGQASAVTRSFLQQNAFGYNMLDYVMGSLQQTESYPDDLQFMVDTASFTYGDGLNFYLALTQKQRKALFDNLPQTTEQILHPKKYFSGEVGLEIKLEDRLEQLGEGWSMDDEDVSGEADLLILLKQKIPLERAMQAAAGWNGDSYRFYRNTGAQQLLMEWVLEFDTDWDAQEFELSANEYFAQFETAAQIVREQSKVTLWLANQQEILDSVE